MYHLKCQHKDNHLRTTVGECLLLNANSTFFQLYHSEKMLVFNDMMITSAYIFFIVQCNNSPWLYTPPPPTRTHYPVSEPTSL